MKTQLTHVMAKAIGSLVAASMVTGCVAGTQPHDRFVHTGPVQSDSSLSVDAPAGSACTNTAAGSMPLHLQGDQAYVSLTVNRSKLNLLLDTADFVTSLTPGAARRLSLPPSSTPGVEMTGIAGTYRAPMVEAADVQYVGQDVTNLPFAVLPAGEFAPSDHSDGLFGANFLSAYNVAIDFAGKQMSFYGASSNCGWSGPGWTASATPVPATDVGFHVLLIPIKVNGVEMNALIDTGSEDTSITARAAAALGVNRASTRHDEVITEHGLGDTSSRMHQFGTITIGSTTFKSPVLAIDNGPSILQSARVSAAMRALPASHAGLDVILGANFLFKKKIYLDYQQHEVFIN
jgi:predicted aspartyl protease